MQNNIQTKFNDTPEIAVFPEKLKDKMSLLVDEIKKQYGIDVEPIKNSKYKLEKLILYIKSKYDFRFNAISRELEYRDKDEKAYKYFETRDFNSILTEIKLENHQVGKDSLKSLIESRQIAEEFNPIKEYLFSLPKWDGTDHIEKYLGQIVLNNELERKDFIETFKKWFIAMVASVLSERIVNQQCLVLVGKQGIYKTTFLNNLIPKTLQLDYLFSSAFNFENKDHFKYLGMKWLINLDELARLSRTDENILKTILTDDRVIVRLPYGAYDSKMWRMASFCGSTNNKEFLKDETGNRRFLVFDIADIKLDEDFELGLIYGQAFSMYTNKFKFWFDRENIGTIEDRNESFHDVSMEEDLIMEYLEKPSDQDIRLNAGFRYETATAINTYLAGKSSRINVNESTKRRIGMVLRKLDYIQRSKKLNHSIKPTKVWLVKYVEYKHIEDSIEAADVI